MLHAGLRQAHRLPEVMQPPAVRTDPGEFIVERAEATMGRVLPGPWHKGMATAAHFAYGALAPSTLSLMSSALEVRTMRDVVTKGAILGTGVWALSYVVALPATGLAAPVHRQGWTHVLSGIASHAVWGMMTLLPSYALSRMTRKGS
jgi:hypothetical protein